MALEYRQARLDEMHEYIYSGQIGFGLPAADEDVDRRIAERPLHPEWTLCAFDDGVLAAKMATIPFTITWNGRDINCGGVTAVTTLPTHRRRGYVGELMRRSFTIMRDSGQPLAMLWASMAAIYQRFGYGNAFTNYLYDFEGRYLQFVEAVATPGRLRLIKSGGAQPLIDAAYERFAAQRTLMLHRSEEGWLRALRLLGTPHQPPMVVAVYEEAGDVLGYVTYDVEDDRQWGRHRAQRIYVLDFVWLTPSAHRALMQFLAAYDLAPTIRLPRVPLDDPLLMHVQEPRRLGVYMTDGSLLRIVDVPAALAARGYDGDGRLTVGLEDDLCPWNTGAWALEAGEGRARIKRTDAEPDLRLSPRALAMLASGHQSATTLARVGLIACADQRALRTADSLFRTACAPFCMDHF